MGSDDISKADPPYQVFCAGYFTPSVSGVSLEKINLKMKLVSGGSTLVEQSPHHQKVEGSSPATVLLAPGKKCQENLRPTY
jgi:hypothetical protein